MKTLPYTERQQQIIDGIIPIKEVHGAQLSRIARKARELGDTDIAERFETELATRAEE